MESDYEDVKQRLMTDERIKKYLYKFLDSVDFEGLSQNLEAKEYEEAFRYAHNLKGVTANLSLSLLNRSSGILCEALRGGEPKEDISPLLQAVTADYDRVVTAITQMRNEEA